LFQIAGGYPGMNAGEDAAIEGKFQIVTSEKGRFCKHTRLPWSRLYYVYRWGHGSYHATGHESLADIRPDVRPGTVELKPHWKVDYSRVAREKATLRLG
jgi:hypothetical protein